MRATGARLPSQLPATGHQVVVTHDALGVVSR